MAPLRKLLAVLWGDMPWPNAEKLLRAEKLDGNYERLPFARAGEMPFIALFSSPGR